MKKYIDIKTIKVSNLVAEYMVKLFFSQVTSYHLKKEFIRIVEIDKLVNEYLSEISCDELEDYVIEINKGIKKYGSRPCFAFVSNKFVGEPLRLYLNSYTEGEGSCIDDFSLASDYYFEDLETGEIKID